jgi:hypothetical protein
LINLFQINLSRNFFHTKIKKKQQQQQQQNFMARDSIIPLINTHKINLEYHLEENVV